MGTVRGITFLEQEVLEELLTENILEEQAERKTFRKGDYFVPLLSNVRCLYSAHRFARKNNFPFVRLVDFSWSLLEGAQYTFDFYRVK